jgi:hypothetical protein
LKIRVAATAAFILTAVTAPSALGAVTIVSDRECYREGEAAGFLGTGFQPGQLVAVSIDGRQIATDTADPQGRISGQITNLAQVPNAQQSRALSMTQTTNPALTGTKTFTETKLYVVTKPSSFRPGRRLRIRAGGFYGAGPTLYGHVRGPKKRNLRIGKVKGPCGKVSATKKRILKKNDSPGFYIVQFDTARKYRGLKTLPQFRRAYTIRRIIKFSRSSSFSAPVFSGPTRWEPQG